MRVSDAVVRARRDRLAALLGDQHYLPLAEVCKRFGISEATARRDLAVLAESKAITRTYGGAMADYNQRFPSFRERQFARATAKKKIAQAAAAFVRAGHVLFFDAGTTAYAVAESLSKGPRPLTIVTNSLPVAERCSDDERLDVHVIAGKYLRRQSVILGTKAVESIRRWRFDIAFLGAEGMTKEGLWNSQADLVEAQRATVKVAERSIFCVDATKLDARAPQFLLAWSAGFVLVTDARKEALLARGIDLGKKQIVSVAPA
jgi:DeoR/GlpR family transcriptional regulator of sugar metabolism